MAEAAFVTLANSHTVDVPGKVSPTTTWPINYYFGAQGDDSPPPQAFHATNEPHSESRAHFHHVDQFQIFFGAADTTFQRRMTGPLLVHYADADTLYGPFSAGAEPFTYMALRPHGNSFKGYLPEHRAEMSHNGAKRHYQHDLRRWLNGDLPKGGGAIIEPFLGPQDDQLAGFTITAPPSAKFSPPSPAGSGGQYYVVVDRELERDGLSLPQFAIGWASADVELPVLVAGNDGALVVVVQFGVSNALTT